MSDGGYGAGYSAGYSDGANSVGGPGSGGGEGYSSHMTAESWRAYKRDVRRESTKLLLAYLVVAGIIGWTLWSLLT